MQLEQVAAVRRDRRVNAEGGDCGTHGHGGLLVRHVVNYLAACELASEVRIEGPLVDVGSGVGGLSAWLAGRLDRPLHLVDHDPDVRAVAAEAFPEAQIHADIAEAPPAAVVTAMEVLEHIRPAEHLAFVTALAGIVRPGGVLVVSTPDESGYPGGWSGYAPHVGPVTFPELQGLLDRTGLPAAVWRISGPGFRLGPVARVVQPTVNRLWGVLTSRAPQVAGRLEATAGRLGGLRPQQSTAVPADAFTIDRDPEGTGTGLIGVAHKMASGSPSVPA